MNTMMRLFRIAAIAEACSWVGLLVGMFFKYVVVHNEVGVKIFGPVHGVLFIGYLITVALVYSEGRWSKRTAVYGLIASVPPLATLWFERYASRRTAEVAPSNA